MLRRLKLRKIPMFLALFILASVIFTLPGLFSDTVSAPYADIGSDGSVSSGPVDHPETAIDTEQPDDPAVSDQPDEFPAVYEGNDFITVHMDITDISIGALLLINSDHIYEIPDESDYITINELRTISYRAANNSMLLSASVIEPLNNMMDAFYAETGSDSVFVISAFRDYEKQRETLNEYIALVGHGEALKWAALPGHSEHQSGLAVDFGVFSEGALRTFPGTGVNAWFTENCYKFGFVLRFPDYKTDVTGTAGEPWHFRYTGEPHAYLMYENDWCLEEYIDILRQYTFDEPYSVTYCKDDYEIYFTGDTDIPIPFDCEIDISGNNVDGFIVTLKFQH